MRPEPEGWRTRGLCTPAVADNFAVERGQTGKAAVRLCALCPIRTRCRDDFLGWPAERQKGMVAGGWRIDNRGRRHPFPGDDLAAVA
jgi:hypothetical protein